MASTLKEVDKNYPGEVRLVFRQFPMAGLHPNAPKAAEASLCAAEQGRFWEMHDLMFEDQSGLKEDDLKAKAARLQLDAAAFAACLDSGKYADKIKRDLRDGALAGVSGTPAVFINGRFLPGAQPYQEMARTIDEELKKTREKR
jgi:protein-disulfide isomerase